jgi:hypothetical protein
MRRARVAYDGVGGGRKRKGVVGTVEDGIFREWGMCSGWGEERMMLSFVVDLRGLRY